MCRNLLSEKSKVNVYSLADLAAISITYGEAISGLAELIQNLLQ